MKLNLIKRTREFQMKKCTCCKETKDISEFQKSPRTNKRYPRCQPCRIGIAKIRRIGNPGIASLAQELSAIINMGERFELLEEKIEELTKKVGTINSHLQSRHFKICAKCLKIKMKKQFHPSTDSYDKMASYCKKCVKKSSKLKD